MFVYLALLAWFSIAAALATDRRFPAKPAWITAMILVVIIGLRWRVGTDWFNYDIILRDTRIGFYTQTLSPEPAYALVNSVAAYAGWGLWFPNLICAIIFVYGLLAFCRQQPNPWLALTVAAPYLIIVVAMGYTRQSAAVGLVMLALAFFARGFHVRPFVCLGIAASFHASAIVMVPLFAMAIATRAFVIALLMGLFAVALYFAFSARIESLLYWYRVLKLNSAGAVPRILMSVFAAGIFLLFRKRFSASAENRRLWIILSAVSLLLLPMLFFVESSTIVDRFGVFLVPLQIFVLSRVPLVFGRQGLQNVGFVLLIALYSLATELVWLNFGNEARNWIPYRNIVAERLFGPAS